MVCDPRYRPAQLRDHLCLLVTQYIKPFLNRASSIVTKQMLFTIHFNRRKCGIGVAFSLDSASTTIRTSTIAMGAASTPARFETRKRGSVKRQRINASKQAMKLSRRIAQRRCETVCINLSRSILAVLFDRQLLHYQVRSTKICRILPI